MIRIHDEKLMQPINRETHDPNVFVLIEDPFSCKIGLAQSSLERKKF